METQEQVKEFLEPHEYFSILKENVETQEEQKLQEQLKNVCHHIISTHEIGQTAMKERLAFLYDCINREQTLLAYGINRYVKAPQITEFIDKSVITENGKKRPLIRIIDLERYQRIIPDKNAEDIKFARNLKIKTSEGEKPLFDDFVVVFTDLTGESMETPDSKEFKKRNLDPIVFGYFTIKEADLLHDNMYFITDWEDEDCDLTLDKLIDKMKESKIKEPLHTIEEDSQKYINDLVSSTIESLKKKNIFDKPIYQKEKQKWYKKLLGIFK